MPKKIKGTVYVGGDESGSRTAKREIDKIKTLARETDSFIYEVSSVFPFQIFPDKIIIDKNKVTIVRRELLFKRLFPILYEDLQTVRINRGILFSSIEFEIRGYETNPGPVTNLWPDQAEKAEKYILGLIKTERENIDLSKIKTSSVKKQVGKVGQMKEDIKEVF